MLFSYGDGEYIQNDRRIAGRIVLGESKLYLQGREGDLTESFIPLEKIRRLSRKRTGVEVEVCPSATIRYTAFLRGTGRYLDELVRDVVERRRLQKRLWRREWIDPDI